MLVLYDKSIFTRSFKCLFDRIYYTLLTISSIGIWLFSEILLMAPLECYFLIIKILLLDAVSTTTRGVQNKDIAILNGGFASRCKLSDLSIAMLNPILASFT